MLRLLFWRRLGIAAAYVLLVTMSLLFTMAPQIALAKTSSVSINPNQRSISTLSVNVVVSSNVVWQNTGISLSVGDTLKISATGSWSADPGDGFTSPDGYTQQVADNFLNLTDIGACSSCASTPTPHWGALIGYIGNNPPAAGSYTSTSILPEAQKVFVAGSNYQSPAKLAGELWLNFNDDAYSANTGDNAGQVTATVTDTPSNKPLGGTWINPANNFVVKGNSLHFAAHAYGGVGGVKYVNFTVWWSAIGNKPWLIACQLTTPSPVNSDMYQCDWNLTDSNHKAILNQSIKVGFDVYDNGGNRILSPNGVHQGKLQRGVSLLAPFNKSDTFYVKNLGGYHNHPQLGCQIGTYPDHCNNQLFGLDLVPNNQKDTTVLAPVGGIITGIPSDPQEFGCMQLMLYDGLTMNVCHFSTWKVSDGQQVVQGQVLGTRSTVHVHLSLDNRQAGKPYVPVPFNGAHTIEGMSLTPNHDGKGETVTYAGQTFKVDVDEWQAWTGTSSN